MKAPRGPNRVQNLEVWQDGIQLVKEIYILTRSWPKEELYGLTTQTRRAAISVPANLAEGKGRESSAEIVRFARYSLGSLYELDTLLQIAEGLGYTTEVSTRRPKNRLASLIRRVTAHIRAHESLPRQSPVGKSPPRLADP